MNIIQATYCRIFQTCFKLSIPVMPYRKPIQLDAVQEIPGVLQKNKCHRVLIVTDKSIHALGLMDSLLAALDEQKIFYAIYDETVANPTTIQVDAALTMYRENSCDSLIGFGGGSSMDCAKAVGARVVNPKKSLADMGGILKVMKKFPLLIAIPTTAGTGSETTLAAVITDAETRHKYAINDFPLIPKYAVLDPEITRSLPPFLTATTGVDAMVHAIEAFIGRSTTKDTRADAKEAVRLIFENLREAYKNGNNMTARRNMLQASFLAGCAFTKSYVGYVHAVAHSLGGQYNTPHGLANAVLLPYVLNSYGTTVWKPLKELQIPEKLEGIREEDIPMLARYAAKEGNPLYPVPKLMTAKNLERFYRDIMIKEATK